MTEGQTRQIEIDQANLITCLQIIPIYIEVDLNLLLDKVNWQINSIDTHNSHLMKTMKIT